MIQQQRVLHELNDVSLKLNDFRTGDYVFPYATGEYLYIGSSFPFNNLWFQVKTANDVATVLSAEIWYANAWVPVVDLMDGTNGLFNSGRIRFNTNIDKGWDYQQRSNDVTGLTGTTIYNMFWVRLSWSVTVNVLTELSYIGQKFSTDTELYSFYPDLKNQNMLDGYTPLQASGTKTNWNEQHFMAAEQVVLDLQKRNIVKARSQLLDYDLFKDASCHKVAELVYTAFGLPYFDMRKAAAESFKKAMDMKNFGVDLNADGKLEPAETSVQVGFGTR